MILFLVLGIAHFVIFAILLILVSGVRLWEKKKNVDSVWVNCVWHFNIHMFLFRNLVAETKTDVDFVFGIRICWFCYVLEIVDGVVGNLVRDRTDDEDYIFAYWICHFDIFLSLCMLASAIWWLAKKPVGILIVACRILHVGNYCRTCYWFRIRLWTGKPMETIVAYVIR